MNELQKLRDKLVSLNLFLHIEVQTSANAMQYDDGKGGWLPDFEAFFVLYEGETRLESFAYLSTLYAYLLREYGSRKLKELGLYESARTYNNTPH